MNIEQLKSLGKLAVFFLIMGIATALGYATWLISTAVSILLAEVILVLIHRSRYISRLYNYFRLEYHRRKRRDCDVLGPFVALCVAPLFSQKLFHINVSSCVAIATMSYLRLLHYFGKIRDFRVLNLLFMLTVNVAYGEFGFGPNTCLWVVFFTYIAIMLGGQAEAGAAHDDDDDDLQHLTLNQIMSNLIIGTFYSSNSDNCFVMVVWRQLG